MGARPYDPIIGRFISPDPVDGGSLNNYDYAGQDPINGYDLAGTARQSLAQADTSPDPCLREICGDPLGHTASLGTIVQRLTTGTATPLTVASLVLDVAAAGCVVASAGECTPLALAALRTSFVAAAVNDKVGQPGANYKRFGRDAGLILLGQVYSDQLTAIRNYLDQSGAGGGRVVQAIYEGLRITLSALIAG